MEQLLLNTMQDYLNSPDPAVRLDWAEDALRHCGVSAAHEKRLAEMKVKEKAPLAPLSEGESVLMAQASQVVEELQRARAYFLGARYIVPLEEKQHLYLLALGRGHLRSAYHLGEMSEEGKFVDDTMKRYRDGADRGDAACLYRLARAYLYGQLGIKKDKEKGISCLQKAAEAADKDFPDPLHASLALALLHLEPPPSEIKARFKLSSSKPLVQHDVSTAVSHLRRAALLGHAPSQLRLGQLHRSGDFDPKDAKKTARKPARSGSLSSRRRSSASAASTGTADAEIDHTLAKHYLHLAARRGLPEADYEIARDLLFDETGRTKQHERLAYAHATRALLGGVPLAFGLMGKAYEEGIGCKKNLELEEKYYYDGRKRGDEWAWARSDAVRKQGVGVDGNEHGYVNGGGR